MAIPTRAELDALIHNRLAADSDFRKALLANPRAAVSELIGIPLPEIVTVDVHEESLTHVHLVIPSEASAGEIADDDLELVAGGYCWGNCSEVPPA